MTGEERFEGVYLSQLSRVFRLFREKLPEVFAANRQFEERTGLHNEAGTNNLVDALSHVGTLVEHADELDYDGQGEQVAHFEDHLRRSMMESFESLVKLHLGETARLWNEHTEIVRPLILAGQLEGLAPIDELEEMRIRVRDLIDEGRATKRDPSWEDWDRGTARLMEACEVVDDLRRRLEEGIAAARRDEQLRELGHMTLRERGSVILVSAISLLVGGGIALLVERGF